MNIEGHEDPIESLRATYDHVYEYVIVAKAIDSEDHVVLAVGASSTLTPWEIVGMLKIGQITYEDEWREMSGNTESD